MNDRPAQVRSIPARAGELRSLKPAHRAPFGLSPRERGNHGHALSTEQRRGSIPARAGEPVTRT